MVVVLGVNECDYGMFYNVQLVFDVDGMLVLKCCKIMLIYYECMIWGQGDVSGLKVVLIVVGCFGVLVCWEYYNLLVCYSLMVQYEEIYCV